MSASSEREYLRVFLGAQQTHSAGDTFSGHEVPAYKHGNLTTGEHALQFFSQIMSNQSLSST